MFKKLAYLSLLMHKMAKENIINIYIFFYNISYNLKTKMFMNQFLNFLMLQISCEIVKKKIVWNDNFIKWLVITSIKNTKELKYFKKQNLISKTNGVFQNILNNIKSSKLQYLWHNQFLLITL